MNKCRGSKKPNTHTHKKKASPNQADQPKGKPWKSETQVTHLSQNLLTKNSLSIQIEKEQEHKKTTTAHLKLNLKEYIQRKNKIHNVNAENSVPTNYRKLELSHQIRSPKAEIFLQQYKIHDGLI